MDVFGDSIFYTNSTHGGVIQSVDKFVQPASRARRVRDLMTAPHTVVSLVYLSQQRYPKISRYQQRRHNKKYMCLVHTGC